MKYHIRGFERVLVARDGAEHIPKIRVTVEPDPELLALLTREDPGLFLDGHLEYYFPERMSEGAISSAVASDVKHRKLRALQHTRAASNGLVGKEFDV